MNIVCIVQARVGSTRLPNKVMRSINGIPMIGLLLERLSKSQQITQIVVATSVDKNNTMLVDYVKNLGYVVFQGNENNVLERYYQAAQQENADVVVRITADCPLVDALLVDKVVGQFLQDKVDYASNREPATYPDGLDVEVMLMSALAQAYRKASTDHEKEHVTPYLIETKKIKKTYLTHIQDLSFLRWTVDELEDFQVIENVFNYF